MNYGINLNSIIPLRAEPDDRSEMVSQLLIGESFTYTDKKSSFYKISNSMDNYTGWIDEKSITSITPDEYNELNKQSSFITTIPLAEAFDLTSKCIIRIPGGSRLPNCDSIGRFGLHEYKFQIHRDFILPESEVRRDGLLLTASAFINAPYLWGGKTVMGIDCSGFTQIVFRMHGIKLPRDSKDQAQLGESVGLSNAQPGDLVFFQNNEGKVVHVGILLEKQRIIHASGRVKIERIDEQGIYSDEYGRYTHTFHSIRRIQ